ncbi:DUF6777 domain-containing protein [Streptomyces sp. NPDC051907]|uniref:DUF6777 domain-containing protein n=1 Tax=Streptomyces sp. NPDC051907 TaxID=3155284 RepID=UPI00341BD316
MPKIATAAIALVAAVVLVVVFTRPGGGGSAAAEEIYRDPVNSAGAHPFTPRTDTAAPGEEPPTTPQPPAQNVSGAEAGTYGGSKQRASCDVEKQIRYLDAAQDKKAAFASALDMTSGEVPGYLRSLTPLRLSYDTRVTNHGYRDGAAYPYQSVLQAGTAVLVDAYAVPRVRCACGNPLKEPSKVENPRLTGPTWSGFAPSKVVEVERSVKVVKVFKVRDPHRGDWFERKPGDHGRHDKKIAPPPTREPSPTSTESGKSPSHTKSPTKKPPSTKPPTSVCPPPHKDADKCPPTTTRKPRSETTKPAEPDPETTTTKPEDPPDPPNPPEDPPEDPPNPPEDPPDPPTTVEQPVQPPAPEPDAPELTATAPQEEAPLE